MMSAREARTSKRRASPKLALTDLGTMPVAAKLRRASQVFHDYEAAAHSWVYGGGVDLKSGKGVLAFEFNPVPDDIGVLIGDCLQNLRSALDHEVYRLSVDAHGPTWSGLDGCQFPIHRERSSFEGARSKQIGGLSIELQRQIESLQTFAVPQNPVADMLVLLNSLARVDRHRLLHVAAAQPDSLDLEPLRPGARALEGTLDVRLRFIDPEFLGVDVYLSLLGSLSAVVSTLNQLRGG
jgi:hypothetical protein